MNAATPMRLKSPAAIWAGLPDEMGGNSGFRLQTRCSRLNYPNETAEEISERELRDLWRRVHETSFLAKVLQQKMPVEGVGGKTSESWRQALAPRGMNTANGNRLPVFAFGCERRCTYCGDPATQRDHIVAVSYQQSDRKSCMSGCGPYTWACGDCNRHLSNRWFDTFEARCSWASWRISIKAKPVKWTNSQISQLDYSLQNFIRVRRERNLWMRFRADYFESREYFLNIENLLWELQQRYPDTPAKAFIYRYFTPTIRALEQLYKPNDSWNC